MQISSAERFILQIADDTPTTVRAGVREVGPLASEASVGAAAEAAEAASQSAQEANTAAAEAAQAAADAMAAADASATAVTELTETVAQTGTATRAGYDVGDDFLGGAFSSNDAFGLGWIRGYANGADAPSSTPVSLAGRDGVVTLSTGSSEDGGALWQWGVFVLDASRAIMQEWVLRIPTLGAAGEEFETFVGWSDVDPPAVAGGPENAVGVMYTSASGWVARTYVSGTTADYALGFAATAGQWVRVRLDVGLTGRLVASIWPSPDDGSGPSSVQINNFPKVLPLSATMSIVKLEGTEARTLEVDYFRQRCWYVPQR